MGLTRIFALLSALLGLGPAAWALPDGAFYAPVDPDCYPDTVWAGLDPASGKPMPAQVRFTQAWIDHCQPSWFNLEQNPVAKLLEYAKLDYSWQQPYARSLRLRLKDGRKLGALLAVKPGGKARDLVVVRCGSFCSANKTGAVVSQSLTNFFEENPVHLLLLDSTTGTDYAKDNGESHIGAFDEGYQNLEAAQYVYDHQAELRLKVRRVHVVGMSLGGLSVLFSSVYKDATPDFHLLPVGSFLALCPLVDADTQFNKVFSSPGPPTLIYESLLRRVFPTLTQYVAPLQQEMLFGGAQGARPRQLDAALNVSVRFYEQNWSRLGFSRYLPKSAPLSRQSLLELNNIFFFRNRFAPGTLVLAAEDDVLLPYENHAGRLARIQDQNLGVLHVRQGSHCAFGQALGWPVFSGFVTHVLGATKDMPKRRLPLPPTLASYFASHPLWPTVTRSLFSWSVSPGSNYATLKIFQFAGHMSQCSRFRATFGPPSNPFACQQQLSVAVPLAELVDLGVPAYSGDAYRANRVERYLNLHTRVLTRSGKLAAGSQEEPAFLEKRGAFHPDYGVY